MSFDRRYIIGLVALVIVLAAAIGGYVYWKAHRGPTDEYQVRTTVLHFGDQLQQVPLIAPTNVLRFAMDKYYALYVEPSLLTEWEVDPSQAPGRAVSSPWPDHIEVGTTTKNADGTYTVDGNIVEVANSGKGNAIAVVDRVPVRFTLTQGPDGWQITGYQKL